jgi:uncharacterized protein YdhG (YjbR/CyaY superfamily)
MVVKDPSRKAHFPAIERKHGKPMQFWFDVMKQLQGKKYPEQISHLRNKYKFSQVHANGLVMYSRGSKSAHRFNSVSDYYKSIDPIQAKTIKSIFKTIMSKYPALELVIAWNHPMLKLNDQYIFGISTAKNHILIAPFNSSVFKEFAPFFKEYKVNKKTIGLPNDWQMDSKLLLRLISAAIKYSKR